MHDFSKVIFFCFILLFSFSALCLDTKTKNIHYFFFGNDFSQDEVIPLPPVSGCHLTASDCTGSTPFFDEESCTCYCDNTSSDCLEDEIFNENYCRCEKCPEKMIPENGHCVCENKNLVEKEDGTGCYCPSEGDICENTMGFVVSSNCDCVCGVSPEICAEQNGYFWDFGNDCTCYFCGEVKIVNEEGNGCVCPSGMIDDGYGNCIDQCSCPEGGEYDSQLDLCIANYEGQNTSCVDATGLQERLCTNTSDPCCWVNLSCQMNNDEPVLLFQSHTCCEKTGDITSKYMDIMKVSGTNGYEYYELFGYGSFIVIDAVCKDNVDTIGCQFRFVDRCCANHSLLSTMRHPCGGYLTREVFIPKSMGIRCPNKYIYDDEIKKCVYKPIC